MRAKEYIACSEASLKHPAEIRQIIDEMLPLRSSRQQTVDYYNRKLIADIRLQACLLQKELYEKNNAMQTAEPEEFQMKEGEIPGEVIAHPVKYDRIKFLSGAYSGKRPYMVVEVADAQINLIKDENGEQIIVLDETTGIEFVAAQLDYTLGKIVEKFEC